MKILILSDNVVVSEGFALEGSGATVSGPPGSTTRQVEDDHPARAGWTLDPETGEFTAPEDGTRYRTLVSRVEYYGLFYPDEEAMIRIATSEVITPAMLKNADDAERQRLVMIASLAVMLRRTDALLPSGQIELKDHQVEAGLDLLVALELLRSPDRRAEILRGVPE